MYPADELDRLGRHKRALLARAEGARVQCCVTGDLLVQPLELVEQAWALWKRVSPFIELAGILFFTRKKATRHFGLLGLLFRWAPKIWGVARSLRAVSKETKTPAYEPAGAGAT